MNDELFWKNLTLDEFGPVTPDEFSAMQLEPSQDPPYIDSVYVNGVCNHTVFIITN